jgi:hypothetical protein
MGRVYWVRDADTPNNTRHYQVLLDTDRDYTFATDVSDTVVTLEWEYGFQDEDRSYANATIATLVLDNTSGRFGQDVVSSPVPLRPTMIVRIIMDDVVLYEGVFQRITYIHTGTSITDDAILETRGMTDDESTLYGIVDRAVEIVAVDPLRAIAEQYYEPKIRIGMRIDEVIKEMMDAGDLTYPYAGNYWIMDASLLGDDTTLFENQYTDFEQARETPPWTGDELGYNASFEEYMEALVGREMGGRLFWDAKAGLLRFHARGRDYDYNPGGQPREISATITGGNIETTRIDLGRKIRNDVIVQYRDSYVGDPDTLLAQYENLPKAIQPGTSRSFRLTFRINGNPVTAYDAYASYGSHIRICTDQAGNNLLSELKYAIDVTGTSVSIQVVNDTNSIIYLTKFECYGTALRYDRAETRYVNAQSVKDNNRYLWKSTNVVEGIDDAENYARTILLQYGEMNWVLRSLAFTVDVFEEEDVDTNMQLQWTKGSAIGDLIEVNIAENNHSGTYILIGERHHVTAFTRVHTVTWYLKPVNLQNVWILGVDEYSTLDESTVLTW